MSQHGRKIDSDPLVLTLHDYGPLVYSNALYIFVNPFDFLSTSNFKSSLVMNAFKKMTLSGNTVTNRIERKSGLKNVMFATSIFKYLI